VRCHRLLGSARLLGLASPCCIRPKACTHARGAGLYGLGMTYGGPVAVIWGWPLVSCFTLTVALSMAEICSAYPTSGALYFWSARLAGPRWAPLASWVTGGWGRASQHAGLQLKPGLASMGSKSGAAPSSCGRRHPTVPPPPNCQYQAGSTCWARLR
jgi:hypothetical protein